MSKRTVWEPLAVGTEIKLDAGGDNMGMMRPDYLIVRGPNRGTLVMSKLSMGGTHSYGHAVHWPDNIRLCRLVDAPATVSLTPEQAAALEWVLEEIETEIVLASEFEPTKTHMATLRAMLNEAQADAPEGGNDGTAT